MGHVDLNEPWSFAFSPDISCLQANKYPVVAVAKTSGCITEFPLGYPNRLDCGGARLSGNRNAAYIGNISSR